MKNSKCEGTDSQPTRHHTWPTKNLSDGNDELALRLRSPTFDKSWEQSQVRTPFRGIGMGYLRTERTKNKATLLDHTQVAILSHQKLTARGDTYHSLIATVSLARSLGKRPSQRSIKLTIRDRSSSGTATSVFVLIVLLRQITAGGLRCTAGGLPCRLRLSKAFKPCAKVVQITGYRPSLAVTQLGAHTFIGMTRVSC